MARIIQINHDLTFAQGLGGCANYRISRLTFGDHLILPVHDLESNGLVATGVGTSYGQDVIFNWIAVSIGQAQALCGVTDAKLTVGIDVIDGNLGTSTRTDIDIEVARILTIGQCIHHRYIHGTTGSVAAFINGRQGEGFDTDIIAVSRKRIESEEINPTVVRRSPIEENAGY